MSTEVDRSESVRSTRWSICWQEFPKSEVVYFSQVLLIYAVVCACLINLSVSQENQSLWSALLSGALGYILPSPTLQKKKNEPLLSNVAEQ